MILHLAQLLKPRIHSPTRPFSTRGAVPRSAAPKIRDCAGNLGQRGLQRRGAVTGAHVVEQVEAAEGDDSKGVYDRSVHGGTTVPLASPF